MVRSGIRVFADDFSTHFGGRRCAAAAGASVLPNLASNQEVLEWR
jgi:hypothetical protein